uniref:Uncharacterized protein n=1 Tax=Strongyloides stercoralis TaxID=6248 RepID=A0AAF5DP13_STRER
SGKNWSIILGKLKSNVDFLLSFDKNVVSHFHVLFIICACNTKRLKIINSLPNRIKSIYETDILETVFDLKLIEIIIMLRKSFFGIEEYFFYSVELLNIYFIKIDIFFKIFQKKMDNSYVIPYNLFLLKYFDTHMNVEIKQVDISKRPIDAALKIFEFPIVGNTITIEVLYIHEEPKNNKNVFLSYLNDKNDFLHNPELNTDNYALKHLMTSNTIEGIISFENLKTINDIVFPIYYDATKYLNLMKDGILDFNHFIELTKIIYSRRIYKCYCYLYIIIKKCLTNFMYQMYVSRNQINYDGIFINEYLLKKKANNHLFYDNSLKLPADSFNFINTNLLLETINYGIFIYNNDQLEVLNFYKQIINTNISCKLMIIEDLRGKMYIINIKIIINHLVEILKDESTGQIIALTILSSNQFTHELKVLKKNLNGEKYRPLIAYPLNRKVDNYQFFSIFQTLALEGDNVQFIKKNVWKKFYDLFNEQKST